MCEYQVWDIEYNWKTFKSLNQKCLKLKCHMFCYFIESIGTLQW